jgi:hypothetical protein
MIAIEIDDMLSDLVAEIDYDVYEKLFVYSSREWQEDTLEKLEVLRDIVRRHLAAAEDK